MKPKSSFDEFSEDSPYGAFSYGYGDSKDSAIPSDPKIMEKVDENRPKILLMGMRRGGKSSIQKVVFHKMSPNETLFLESTSKIVKHDIANSSFVQFQIWDFPGQIDFFESDFDAETIFADCGALIFVIDAQDKFEQAITKLQKTFTKAYEINPHIVFEVFTHKVDGITDDKKRIETHSAIQEQVLDALGDLDIKGIGFHLTSIYDHSIFEAFSKVIQKLIPHMGTLENLLDILVSSCGMEKALLIDVVSKIYIATDTTSPVDMTTYELCSDMIDVAIDVSCIYGMKAGTAPTAYDPESHAVIKLTTNAKKEILYLREVNKYLALVCIMREDHFEKHGLIDYNFMQFKKAIQTVFSKRKVKKTT